MAYAKINSFGVLGLEAYPVEIEVDISRGLPALAIVGLASKAIEESKDRVRGALKNAGFKYPTEKIIVNLAPADTPKHGAVYDIGMALGLLVASDQIEPRIELARGVFLGELSLDGQVRATQGVLAMALASQEAGFDFVVLPRKNLAEASLVKGIKLVPVDSLRQLVGMLAAGQLKFDRIKLSPRLPQEDYEDDFSHIYSQENAKRALTLAAAGGHNLLMVGPPGTGKTLLARSLPSILPKLSFEDCLEVTKIYSVAGQLPGDKPVIFRRPFRAPHHTASHIALVGGGSQPRPGEITLAHKGVLFLDELPEFPRRVLESLRQPLEDGRVVVARARGSLTFPAQFILVASANPCPCGFLGDSQKSCRCTNAQIVQYQKKLSGPLLDRIDLQVQVPRVNLRKMAARPAIPRVAQKSAAVRKKIEQARQLQTQRFKKLAVKSGPKIQTNSQMSSRQTEKFCQLESATRQILQKGIENLNISARGYHKILKISRTIADLASCDRIKNDHVLEALAYYENREEILKM